MTTPSRKTAYSKPKLEEMAESVGFWWHSIDLGQGVVTKGYKKPETLRYEHSPRYWLCLERSSDQT